MLTFTQKQSRPCCAGKVTIVELLWVSLLIAGGLAGAIVGCEQFGFWGLAIGLFLGLVMGLLVSCLIAFFLNIYLRKRRDTKS
jgi:hypothetical protein